MAVDESTESQRVCRACLEQKPIDLFYPSAYYKSGRETKCKTCKIASNTKYQKTEKSRARRSRELKQKWESSEEFRQKSIRRANEFASRPEVKARYAARSKARRVADPDHARKIAKANYERQKQNPGFLLAARIRAGVRKAMSARLRSSKTFEILGYSPADLVRHIERQFTNGMSWKNFGDWHIDHIVPLAALRPNSESEVAAAWALSNLRPLWSSENMKKHSKVLHLV